MLKSTSKKTKSASTKKDEEIKVEKKTATAKKATAKAKAAPKAKAPTKVKKTTAVRAKKAAPRPKRKKFLQKISFIKNSIFGSLKRSLQLVRTKSILRILLRRLLFQDQKKKPGVSRKFCLKSLIQRI